MQNVAGVESILSRDCSPEQTSVSSGAQSDSTSAPRAQRFSAVSVYPPDIPEHRSSQERSCLPCPRLLWTILKPSVSYKPPARFPPLSFNHEVAGLAHLPASPQLRPLYTYIIFQLPGKAPVSSTGVCVDASCVFKTSPTIAVVT